MAREPIVGNDNDNWGTVLNTFLSVGHNTDGTTTQNVTASNIQPTGTQAAGSNALPSAADHVHPAPAWVLADNNLLAATASLDSIGSGALTVAGSLYLNKIPIRTSFTTGTVWISISGAGSGTSTNSFLGLYSLSGSTYTLIAQTNDISGNVSTGAKNYAFQSSVSLTAGQQVFGAILTNLSVTQPTIRQYSGASAPAANMNLTTALSRTVVNGTTDTGVSALPATLSTGNNNVSLANPYWMGLST